MKTHILLIGFSCTGKTSVGREAFGEDAVLDSDAEVRRLVGDKERQPFDHIYEIYMRLGRDRALALIEEAENALVDMWACDATRRIISLGPGFPFRDNWGKLRAISYVILFRRSPEKIYESMKERRSNTFRSCPEAKKHDNWDIGVIVDDRRVEFTQEVATSNICRLLNERERYYCDNDAEVSTDNKDDALQRLGELKSVFDRGPLEGKPEGGLFLRQRFDKL